MAMLDRAEVQKPTFVESLLPRVRTWWRALLPIAVTALLAMAPAPDGLPQHGWYYFAIFAGVIVALISEPLPGGAVGLIGVSIVAFLCPFVLFSPTELARPGFRAPESAVAWALSGFSNGTVWLIFAAFMFALGYEKSGLGRRIALILVRLMGRRTLTLGYAVTLADLVLAPFTPSNTARSAGTIYPVIRNLPSLYHSLPNDPSSRKVGSYIMWVAIAATSVTSSMFLTSLAPNLLAIELAKKSANVELNWVQWFVAFGPVGILLLIATPLVTFWIYPPEVKKSDEAVEWAREQLAKTGPVTSGEIVVAVLALVALLLWIFGANYVNATAVAVLVVSLMLLTRSFSWADVLEYKSAWNTLVWFATLVALADGLNRVGFVKWFAESVGHHLAGISPTAALVILVALFFFSHYMFASITAHVTALMPVMLAVGASIPGLPMAQYALLLSLTLGIMGIISPYGTGPSPVYYGSGYLPSADFWRLGAVFGLLFFAIFLLVGVPWVLFIG
jgi:L-tartrate/succinate antiporter